MSRICIGILDGHTVDFESLDAELRDLRKQFDVSVSYGLSYKEPFLEHYKNNKIITLNFADNNTHDICEMLFLPDNCSYNGAKNVTRFHERMRNVEAILIRILKCCSTFDLYIGESGMQIDEFEDVSISIHDFYPISHCLNTVTPPDLHLIISR